ncbi:MAG: glycosyl hydrolase, partial [Planctomycetota bacterium]
MTKSKPILLVVCSLLAVATAVKGQELEKQFDNPPNSAKPWVYWWWLDSYATKDGITKDLEEMKRQGISGALIFDAGDGIDSPDGPVFMSPAWRELYKHAIKEADRLGIDISVNLCSGWNAGGTWVKPEHACKKLVYSAILVQGPRNLTRDLPKPESVDDYYRDVAVIAFKIKGGEKQTACQPIKNFKIKAGKIRMAGQPPDQEYAYYADVSGEQDLNSSSLVDLSNHMNKDGRFVWQVPDGKWAVQRFGYTLYGQKTKFYSPGSQGYEIDPFSAEAMDMHFAATAQKLIDDAGPLAGKTLKYFHIDSWEIRCPTWTPKLRQAFKARRDYDLLPYLPVLTGKIVDSREVSNRFLWDYRQTIGDLIVDNYYGRLAELSHKHGIGTHSESAGYQRPNVDALKSLGVNDIPMTEFWARQTEPDGKIHQMYPSSLRAHDAIKLAASTAHIYGKELCQAEAFTTMGPNWEKDPFMLKDIGDRAFCDGLTRNVLCFYVHQPRLDIKPGYQWELAGTHFDRNITWWPQIHAWLDYLSRCQLLLKQGLFVADVCYFYGEDVPNYVPAKRMTNPPLPAGYDCDTVNSDVLLNRISSKDGRIVLPDGMSYRYLVLPHRSTPTMSVKVLRKIKDLVRAGATVIGPK